MKRNFSGIHLKEVMRLVPAEVTTPWQIEAMPRPPSEALQTHLRRLEAFDLQTTEQAKTLLIDALFAETVFPHPKLKVWKAATLNTDTLTGVADYLIAPKRAYLETPLLCAVEAKRDDFERGRAQCLAELVACRENNRKEGHEIDVFGIVSNGQAWQFYKLTPANEVYETPLYSLREMNDLLNQVATLISQSRRFRRKVPILICCYLKYGLR